MSKLESLAKKAVIDQNYQILIEKSTNLIFFTLWLAKPAFFKCVDFSYPCFVVVVFVVSRTSRIPGLFLIEFHCRLHDFGSNISQSFLLYIKNFNTYTICPRVTDGSLSNKTFLLQNN